MPGPVSVTKTAKWSFRAVVATVVGELDGVLNEIEQHLREALLVAEPTGSDLSTEVVSVSFLFWASDSVAPRTVSTTVSMAYSAMLRVNWPYSILAMSRRCLTLERMRVRASIGFTGSGT